MPALGACEQTDTRTQAANIIYNNCINSGADKQWCRCLRADLIAYENSFTEEIANYTINKRQHPYLGHVLTGARLRCQCRISPHRMAAHGLTCAGVKQVKF